ncbi:hypothetical protein M8C21_020901 [Ambrosia artemisiifolia]|uniref:Uncharacterized protein n=1 Tax=Ambrosia artemisiifolia TaxID=4212 RepID=A0AAD5GNF3_AMBAR|nr:hypothetical protein M8C21_020901 [Ambrosia artemisiifolia]
MKMRHLYQKLKVIMLSLRMMVFNKHQQQQQLTVRIQEVANNGLASIVKGSLPALILEFTLISVGLLWGKKLR